MGYLEDCILAEQKRQQNHIELIASENYVSEAVCRAVGGCMTNKYSEGYPEKTSVEAFTAAFPDYVHSGSIGRYYGGCENVDRSELYCRYLFQKAFHTDYHVNVQPHSGSNANFAAFLSVLQPGDRVLSMNLNNGGHLTHGSPVNLSGKLFDFCFYDIDENGFIDYQDVAQKAREFRPKLILAGASAYSRIIHFDRFAEIAKEVGAILMVDMAHISGLVATGYHPSPFGLADLITMTTHKTFRGPRGGVIFCKRELAKKVDSAVFPGTQGGPLQHIIAGKAVAAEEACQPAFRDYIGRVVENCQAMCQRFRELGYDIVSGGTDNHLFLIDLTKTGLSGKQVQNELDRHGITANKNCVPQETRSPQQTSGLRVGTAAMTTLGWGKEDFIRTADEMDRIIRSMQEK